jgi:mono/diheme cytochrome c family protein
MFFRKIFIDRRAKMKRTRRTIIGIVGSIFLFASFSFAGDSKSPPKTPELLKQGKKLFEQNCAVCHGSKGDGKGPTGAILNPPPTDFQKPLKEWPYTKGDLQKIFEVISKGIPNSSMVPWAQYSEQERWALAYTTAGFAARPGKK